MRTARTKVKKRKSHKGRIIFFILIIITAICAIRVNNIDVVGIISGRTVEYDVIGENDNKNYSGGGQQAARGKDGYFTTFTTSENDQKTYREYKQNGNASWSGKDYWSGTMADNGCGITAIATILSGYGKDYTPGDLREKYYPVLDNEKISQTLKSDFGIKNSNFYYDSTHLSKKTLTEHLLTNRPVLICVWNKSAANRWTTASHYMVLLAADGNGKVYVSNPNGLRNTYNSSGWYNFDEVLPYIAKALYIESYK